LDRYGKSVPPYRLDRGDKLVALAVTVFFFLLYFLTCSHYVNIAGDSPELIGGTYSLGILHPPGYPTYTMVGYVVSHIPIGSIAFRVNLMSVIFHSAAILILFIILKKITLNRTASLIAVFILGTSYLFWFYSLLAEVFPINDFFAVLLILMAIWVRERWLSGNCEGSKRLFVLLAFLCGLSLTHHQTILLVFPVVVLITLRPLLEVLKKPRYLILSVAVFILGLLPYIYLPIRASSQPYMNFGDPSSFSSFFNVVTRRTYGSTRLWIGPSAAHRMDLVFDYLNTLNKEVYILGILLGILGMFRMARRRMGDFLPLMTGFILAGIIFPLMANVELHGPFEISTIERFYLLPTIFFCFFIASGIEQILAWIRKGASRLDLREGLRHGLVIVAVLLIIFPFILPFHRTLDSVNLRNDTIGEAYTDNLLSPIEDGAVLILAGDVPVETVDFYYRMCYENKRDVTTIIWSFWGLPWYMDHLRKWYPELKLPDTNETGDLFAKKGKYYKAWLVDYLIKNNPQVTDFYTIEKNLGIERDYEMLPYGLAYKIVPLDAPIDYDEYAGFLVNYFGNLDRRGLDYPLYGENRREIFLIQYYSMYMNEAVTVLRDNGQLEEASIICASAFETYPFKEYEWKAADIFMEMGSNDNAEEILRDYADRGLYYDEKTWQALIDIEKIEAEKGAE